jgi:hypothetical protein
MITELTPGQQAALDQWHAKWLAVGTCTLRADRPTAEEAITAMYRTIGQPDPRFVWCDSPATAILAKTVLQQQDSLGDSLRDSLRDSLWDSLGGSLGDSLGGSLRGSLRDSLRGSLGGSLRDSLWDSLGDSLRGSLRDSLRGSLWGSLRGSLGDSLRGAHESYWIAYYLFCREVLGVTYDPARSEQLDWWADIARSALWWWPHQGTVIISERPTICRLVPGRNGRYQLHATDRPALAFADGYQVYAIGGVRVPEQVVTAPDQITADEWVALPNEEVRRVVIEQRGETLLTELAATVVDETVDTLNHPVRLWKTDRQVAGARLTIVELINSTPEPDGHHRHYWIRVPNTLRRAASAAAWHCQLTPDEWRRMKTQT